MVKLEVLLNDLGRFGGVFLQGIVFGFEPLVDFRSLRVPAGVVRPPTTVHVVDHPVRFYPVLLRQLAEAVLVLIDRVKKFCSNGGLPQLDFVQSATGRQVFLREVDQITEEQASAPFLSGVGQPLYCFNSSVAQGFRKVLGNLCYPVRLPCFPDFFRFLRETNFLFEVPLRKNRVAHHADTLCRGDVLPVHDGFNVRQITGCVGVQVCEGRVGHLGNVLFRLV